MQIKLLDCTLRDGGNLNNWDFTMDNVNHIIHGLDKSGIDIIEVGYVGGSGSNKAKTVGGCARCDKAFFQSLPKTECNIAAMIVPTVCPIDKLKELKDANVNFARVATYYRDRIGIERYIDCLKEYGLKVSVNLMGVSYLAPKQVAEFLSSLIKYDIDVFYIADSFGALLPNQVEQYIGCLVEQADCAIGFHAHNNLGLAFTNVLKAMETGAVYIDTSLRGMARGAGNLPTEQFLTVMYQKGEKKYQLPDILNTSEYVLKEIMGEPISIAKKEIECGLYNIHYYYYDMLLQECMKQNRSPYEIGKKLGDLKPDKVDLTYIQKIIER